MDKKIYRLTNVELYDFVTNGSDQFSAQKLKKELDSRNLTVDQILKVKTDYLQYKKLQQERKEQSLTTQEYLTLFIFPFFTPKPRWRNDHLSQSEFERYQTYGFDKKHVRAIKVRRFGMFFWILFFMVNFLIYHVYIS